MVQKRGSLIVFGIEKKNLPLRPNSLRKIEFDYIFLT